MMSYTSSIRLGDILTADDTRSSRTISDTLRLRLCQAYTQALFKRSCLFWREGLSKMSQ